MDRDCEYGLVFPSRLDITSMDPLLVLQDREFRQRLADDCSRLPDKESQVIALRYGSAGFTQAETARVLEVSRSTVVRLERDGLDRLRKDELLRHAYDAA
mgnify:CR=1 FL=1